MTRARLVAIVSVLGLLLAGCNKERGQRAHVSDDGFSWIRAPFKVRAGDTASWSEPSFDDRGWQEVDARLLPGTAVAGWQGIAWFRGWIEIGPERSGHPVPVYGRFVGAAEIFVDGARVFATADPAAVLRGGSTPVDFTLDTPHWITFAQPGRHLIAVRFASRDLAAMQRVGFPGGFELSVGSEATPSWYARSAGWLLNTSFIGATFALALLHLLLFLFHRSRPENLYYALATCGVACITVFDGGLRWATTASGARALIGAVGAAITISAVVLLRFYHAVFSRETPRSYWLAAAVAATIAVASWSIPRTAAYGFAAIMAIAQFVVLIAAIARGARGAWIIGVGGALWLLGSALQMLGDVGWTVRVAHAYLYGFLALLGSMSVYLAREIAYDKGALARKLVEVSELSARQRQAMERYRTVFETTGTCTIMFGDDAIISLANDEWAQLTGYTRGEIEGRMTWMEFLSDRSLATMEGYRTREAQLRDRHGKLHEGVITINKVPGTEERVGSFLDLTELKRAQRQMVRADKLSALGQIAAGVAHEINNPNNFIHFNLPILRRYVEAMQPLLERELEREPDIQLLNMRYEVFIEDLFKLIDNMEHGSSRITAIVKDLKNYVRSGEETAMTTGSIADVIHKVMALVGKQVSKMVKRVEVVVDERLPAVTMSAGKIEQVLINLLINAAQAADKEASWVKLSACSSAAGDGVEIRVEDNGAGIPAENMEQIFEPFYTTKGRDVGTGLGLSISQQIIEEHGGRIEVTSEVSVGTCFKVRLPSASTR